MNNPARVIGFVNAAHFIDHYSMLIFAAADPGAFSPEMGAELVAFLARVVERTAERWPVL